MWFWKQLNLWFLNAKIQPGVDFRRGKWQCLGVIKITVHSMPYLIRHTLCTCNMRENSRRVGRSAAPAVSPDIHPSTTPPTTPVLRVTPTVYLPNSSARKIVFAAGAVFSASFFSFFFAGVLPSVDFCGGVETCESHAVSGTMHTSLKMSRARKGTVLLLVCTQVSDRLELWMFVKFLSFFFPFFSALVYDIFVYFCVVLRHRLP